MHSLTLVAALLLLACSSEDSGAQASSGGASGSSGVAGGGGAAAMGGAGGSGGTTDAGACAPVAANSSLDVPYAAISGVDPKLLSLDAYTPALSDGCAQVPIVIWVHGGAWAIGDKANSIGDKVKLFNAAGYTLVSVNYRLSPTKPSTDPNRVMYPTHPTDVAAAVHWVKDHSAELHGDPKRIALLGHSAGAHLVALLGTDESFLAQHSEPLSTLRCVGSFDTEAYDVPATLKTASAQQVQILENAFGTDPAVQTKASPLFHVSAGKGIPPFLIVVRGGADRQATQLAFQKALVDVGVSAGTIDAAQLSHEQVNSSIGASGDSVMTPKIMAFLDGCFASP